MPKQPGARRQKDIARMMKDRRAFLLFLCFWMTQQSAFAQHFESGLERVSLLELFSSEGCSSCQPADAWMNRLTKDPALWKDFVPVVFHVDYWDYLGWKDPFAEERFSNHQRQYAAAWANGSIYTPGFVLNGQEWRGWQRFQNPPTSQGPGGILKVEGDNAFGFQVSYQRVGSPPSLPRAHIAILGFDLESDVSAGENMGRRLTHNFVVLKYDEKVMERDGNVLKTKFQLNAPQGTHEKLGVAIWVSNPDDLKPFQAVGGYL